MCHKGTQQHTKDFKTMAKKDNKLNRIVTFVENDILDYVNRECLKNRTTKSAVTKQALVEKMNSKGKKK